MQNIVTYVLGLQSGQFESGLARANSSVNSLETSLGGITKALGAIAVAGFAFNFLKDTVRMFNESEQASAQLNATLKSTGNIAMLNREALDKQAQSIMQNSLFDDDAITGAQSVLATFTQIKSEVFNNAIPAIADLATKMGGDLQGATIQVGKALNDPIKGVSALQRVGVSFTASQKELIKSLVDTGNAAEAQKMILDELNTEFGGSAKASAEAGTGGLTVLQHEMDNVKEEIGGVVMVLIKEFMPAIKSMVSGFKDLADWVKENRTYFGWLGESVMGVGSAFKEVDSAMQNIFNSTNKATNSVVSFINAFNPLTYALTSLNGIYNAMVNLGKLREDKLNNESLNADAQIERARLKDIIASNKNKTQSEVLALEEQRIKNNQAKNKALYELKNKEQSDFQDSNETGASNALIDIELKKISQESQKLATQLAEVEKFRNGGATATAGAKSAPITALTNKAKTAKTTAPKFDKAQGQKSITINVSIKDLIGTYNSTVTNVQGNATKIKEAVLGALTGAVNDFQIVSGQ
jgi:hypothetical protein